MKKNVILISGGMAAAFCVLLSGPTAQAATALHHWTFDSADVTATTAADVVGGNTGTLSTGAGPGGSGAFVASDTVFGDGAFDNVAGNDRVSFTNVNFADDVAYSFSLWCKKDSATASSLLIGDTTQNYDEQWFRSNGTVQFRWNTGSNYGDLPDPAIVATDWNHIAMTVSETGIAQLYVNGVPFPATATVGNALVDFNAIGAGRVSSSSNHKGLIDEVWIFSGELTAEEVANLYENNAGNGGGTNTALGLTLDIDVSESDLEFTWDSQAGKVYDLRSSLDLTTDPADWSPYNDGVTTHKDIAASGTGTNTLSGVARSGTPRFFVLFEEDAPAVTLLDEDFDDAASLPLDWASTGPSNGTDWQVGIPTGVISGPSVANTTPNCAGTNIGGYYTESADVSLTSPVLAVPVGRGAILSFRQFIDTDLVGDVGSVRILDVDNSDTPIDGLEILNIQGDGLAGWTAESLEMTSAEVGGKNIKVEIRFESNVGDVLDFDVWGGFYIDDFLVEAD